MTQTERIIWMEQALNESVEALTALETALEQYRSALPKLQKLSAYYQSPLWLSDFDDDRAGKIPATLSRGVLTEDAVYDLLTDQVRLVAEMKALLAERG